MRIKKLFPIFFMSMSSFPYRTMWPFIKFKTFQIVGILRCERLDGIKYRVVKVAKLCCRVTWEEIFAFAWKAKRYAIAFLLLFSTTFPEWRKIRSKKIIYGPSDSQYNSVICCYKRTSFSSFLFRNRSPRRGIPQRPAW